MMFIVLNALIVFIGLAGGIAVGSGFVSVIVMLDLIPRLVQLSRSHKYIQLYESAVVSGVMVFTFADFFNLRLHMYPVTLVFIGLFAGCFVGMLAAALTEVLNVLPILVKRLRLDAYLLWLLTAMVLGKIAGSLLDWILNPASQ